MNDCSHIVFSVYMLSLSVTKAAKTTITILHHSYHYYHLCLLGYIRKVCNIQVLPAHPAHLLSHEEKSDEDKLSYVHGVGADEPMEHIDKRDVHRTGDAALFGQK